MSLEHGREVDREGLLGGQLPSTFMNSDEMNELLQRPVWNVKDYCRFRGICTQSAARERCQKTGPIYCKRGRQIYYYRDDVLAWMDKGRRQHTKQAVNEMSKLERINIAVQYNAERRTANTTEF